MVKRSKKQRDNIIWRILVFIISGIVLDIWAYATGIILLINWFIVVFKGKRNEDLGTFGNYFASEVSRFVRYLSFESEEKPFPFNEIKVLKR